MAIGEAVIHVECDTCEFVTDPMAMTLLAGGGWDARNIPQKLKHEGWRVEGKLTICPECVEAEQEAAERAANGQNTGGKV